jgi:hypothetical protein
MPNSRNPCRPRWNEPASALVAGVFVLAPEPGELDLSAHEWRVEAPGETGGPCMHGEQPPRSNGVCLSFEVERVHRLHLDGVLDEPVRLLAQKDLAGSGGLLEASGHVDGITSCIELGARWIAGHDLPGIHAGADGEGDAPLARELLVERDARACLRPRGRP